MEHASLVAMSHDECIAAVRSVKVGRLGLLVNNMPEVLPLNFVLDDDESLLFRVERQSSLALAVPATACFEADEVNNDDHSGWSVLAQGRLRDVSDAIDEGAEHLRTLLLSPWSSGEKATWLAMRPRNWSGRRLG